MLAKAEKNGKIQNSKIYNSFEQLLVETLPRSMLDFVGVNLVRAFRGDVGWNFFPIWSYVNENGKKTIIKNKKINKILKKKRSGDMVDRYLSLKFCVNPLDGFL